MNHRCKRSPIVVAEDDCPYSCGMGDECGCVPVEEYLDLKSIHFIPKWRHRELHPIHPLQLHLWGHLPLPLSCYDSDDMFSKSNADDDDDSDTYNSEWVRHVRKKNQELLARKAAGEEIDFDKVKWREGFDPDDPEPPGMTIECNDDDSSMHSNITGTGLSMDMEEYMDVKLEAQDHMVDGSFFESFVMSDVEDNDSGWTEETLSWIQSLEDPDDKPDVVQAPQVDMAFVTVTSKASPQHAVAKTRPFMTVDTYKQGALQPRVVASVSAYDH